jgi:uncharacterized membrane protein YbhN (UPF0104 family)
VTVTTPTSSPSTDLDVAEPPRIGPRLFATEADEPRARRAGDVLLLVGAAVVALALSTAADPLPRFVRDLDRLLTGLPGALDPVWQLLADLLTVLALAVAVASLIRRRWTVTRDLLVAAVVTLACWVVLGRLATGQWPDVLDAVRSTSPPPFYPSLRVALTGAVVLTATPHLTRPARRLGHWAIALAGMSTVMLGATGALGALAAVAVAMVAAAVVHLVFGSSAGRPSLKLVRSGLTDVGVTVVALGATDRQQAGLFTVDATEPDGGSLLVKVYGRDAYDSALVSTIWRTIWYREAGAPRRFGRREQVEHEAFVTLFAQQGGILTDEVVTAGTTVSDDALLVLRRRGRSLDEIVATEGSASVEPAQLWALVDRLGATGIAHGVLDLDHLLVGDDGTLGIRGFRGATVAPTEEQRRADDVQALITTVQLVGSEAAIAAARDEVGPERLAAALPYLQPPTLTPDQRRAARDGVVDLDELREAAAVAAGVDAPKLEQLRRITVGSLIRVVLPALAVFMIVSALADLDVAAFRLVLSDASWVIAAIGFVVTQLPRFTQALSTLGSVPIPLPLGPVYALQLATSYINIAIPSAAARIAMNIRFSQRHGLPPATAVASGALDGLSGFIVQASLLIGLLMLTPLSIDLDLSSTIDDTERLLLGLVIFVGAVVAVVLAVSRLRQFVVGWTRRVVTEAAAALKGLASFRRIALLFGGNLATEILFAASLGVFVAAMGYRVGLDELLLINMSVALLSGLIPIPGGIGVTEGGLTFGLVQAGVPEEVAFAAVLLYRLASFYLPPIWGFFALRWLERNDHL